MYLSMFISYAIIIYINEHSLGKEDNIIMNLTRKREHIKYELYKRKQRSLGGGLQQ